MLPLSIPKYLLNVYHVLEKFQEASEEFVDGPNLFLFSLHWGSCNADVIVLECQYDKLHVEPDNR